MKRPVPAQNPFASIGMPSSGRALATQTRNSTVTLARFRSDDPDFSVLKRLSADDSYVLIFQRTNMPGHEVWTGGRHLRRPPTRQAALNIFDVNSVPACRLTGTPGGVEALFRQVAGLAPAEIAALAASFGTHVVGPPIID